MSYIVNSGSGNEFSNIKRIAIGSGKVFCVYKDDAPYVSVEVNLLNSEHFTDSLIVGDYLLIGNYYEGVYVIDLLNLSFDHIAVDGYFGYFVEDGECIYILGCENIIAMNRECSVLWKSDCIAVDGITCEGIEGKTMQVTCEMDPPGGWVDKKIDLCTGKVIA